MATLDMAVVDKIVFFLNRKLVRQHTEEEGLELDKLLDSNDFSIEELEELRVKDYMHAYEEYDAAANWINIRKRLFPTIYGEDNNRIFSFYRLVVAACFVAASVVCYFRFFKGNSAEENWLNRELAAAMKVPALVLTDGSIISLDSLPIGHLIEQNGASVEKVAKGELRYHPSSKYYDKVYGNTVFVPKATRYKISLPDETQVWLNAGSTIRYATNFSDTNRKVYLVGEAYFEVPKNRSGPFKVKTAGAEILVTGTKFNVNAYPDEPVMAATVIEGSLAIAVKTRSIRLAAGKEAHFKRDSIEVHPGPASIDWIEGVKEYHGRIDGLMRLIERHYDVEVVYQGVSQKQLGIIVTFGIPAEFTLAQVIKLLNDIFNEPSVSLKVVHHDKKLVVIPQ